MQYTLTNVLGVRIGLASLAMTDNYHVHKATRRAENAILMDVTKVHRTKP